MVPPLISSTVSRCATTRRRFPASCSTGCSSRKGRFNLIVAPRVVPAITTRGRSFGASHVHSSGGCSGRFPSAWSSGRSNRRAARRRSMRRQPRGRHDFVSARNSSTSFGVEGGGMLGLSVFDMASGAPNEFAEGPRWGTATPVQGRCRIFADKNTRKYRTSATTMDTTRNFPRRVAPRRQVTAPYRDLTFLGNAGENGRQFDVRQQMSTLTLKEWWPPVKKAGPACQ